MMSSPRMGRTCPSASPKDLATNQGHHSKIVHVYVIELAMHKRARGAAYISSTDRLKDGMASSSFTLAVAYLRPRKCLTLRTRSSDRIFLIVDVDADFPTSLRLLALPVPNYELVELFLCAHAASLSPAHSSSS